MAVAIHDGNISKKEKILMLSLKSPVHFGQLFLPRDFRTETASAFHYEIGNLIDDKTFLKPIILMLPRGHAKTKMTQASILKDIATLQFDTNVRKRHFIVWVAQNKTQSMRNVNFIMSQIENNSLLRYYFGDLKGTGKWNQEELDFSNGSSLICRAGLHGIRGLLKDELRPNRFVLDDFEYEGNTKTIHSRNLNAATVTSVIIPGLDPEIGRLQINQTPVHYDCFIMRIYDAYKEHLKEGRDPEDFQWKVVKKVTKINKPLWPEYFDSQLLLRRKTQLHQAGELHKWFQEYEMEVSTAETALFGADTINYWDGDLEFDENGPYLVIRENDKVTERVYVNTFIGVDPSSDIQTRTSSDTAIIEIAVDSRGRVFVLDYLTKKNLPDIALDGDEMKNGTSNQVLERGLKIKCSRAGIEKHAVSSGVFNSITYLKDRNLQYKNVVIVPVSHKGENKIDRIYNGLVTLFKSKKIYIKQSHTRLENEINTFGEFAKYIDLLDALEIGVRVSYKPVLKKKEEEKVILRDYWEKKYETNTGDNWKTA